MRPDLERPSARVFGERDRERRRQAARVTVTLEDLLDAVDMRHVALENLPNGVFESPGAVRVEQHEEPLGRVPEVLASLGEALEKRSCAWSGVREPIEASVLARGALLLGEG